MEQQGKRSDVHSRVTARALLFWGSWLVFVPSSALVVWLVVCMFLDPYPPGAEAEHIGVAVAAVIVVLAAVPWVHKVTRDYLGGRRAERKNCE